MPRRDPAKAVELIDYLLTYYADGLHWRHPDPEGNLSLPEALHYLRRRHSLKRDGTGYFIQDAMPRRTDLASFDSACRISGSCAESSSSPAPWPCLSGANGGR
jgi:hypothetical protein